MTKAEDDKLGEMRKIVNIHEGEINLRGHFLAQCKWRWFVFLASVLPILKTGLTILLWIGGYVVVCTYNTRSGKKNLKVPGYKSDIA
jgi:hypothetical protein